MVSEIAANMMRRRHRLPVDDGEMPGHPHMEAEHDAMDRQHAYESAMQGLESLEKEGMPGAKQLHESLMKYWHTFVGEKGMQPATKMSHRANPVSKSPMDEHDEELDEMYKGDKYDASKE